MMMRAKKKAAAAKPAAGAPLTKDDVRRQLRERLRTLSVPEQVEKNLLIRRRLFERPEVRESRLVMAYVSRAGEADTHAVIEQLLSANKRVAVPLCVPEKLGMIPCEIRDFYRDLQPGFKGILEPVPARTRQADPAEIDLVIVPLLGFTEKCDRLGRGLGYFDRFIEKLGTKCKKVGLAFACQRVEELPLTPNDKRLDLIITEERIYEA